MSLHVPSLIVNDPNLTPDQMITKKFWYFPTMQYQYIKTFFSPFFFYKKKKKKSINFHPHKKPINNLFTYLFEQKLIDGEKNNLILSNAKFNVNNIYYLLNNRQNANKKKEKNKIS